MDPINPNPDNSEAQVIDDNLEKIVQDFNEFRDKVSQSTSSDAMNLEDIIDLYIESSCENPYKESHGDEGQFTALLLSTPPPHQITSPLKQQSDSYGFSMDTEIQENQAVNVNDGNVTYIRYGDLNYDGAAGDFIGRVFGCDMNFWWRGLCGTAGGKKVKRKYRRDMQSEEETAHRAERTKLNNRESATKTHDNTKASETYIRTQMSNEEWISENFGYGENGFTQFALSNFEARKFRKVRPEPLRRTISGPQ